MKKIPLTKGKYAIVDDKDLAQLSKFKWCVNDSGYAVRVQKLKTIRMHRVVANTPKGKDTDHINRNRLDNRRANLRVCTRSQNMGNMLKHSDNTSGFRGVCFNKKSLIKPWYAQLNSHYLGTFPTKEQAAEVYNKAAKKLFGKFANLNKV